MKVGVPRETWPGENRVALIPSAAAALKKNGLDVVVEQDAGVAAGFPPPAHQHAGTALPPRRSAVFYAHLTPPAWSRPPPHRPHRRCAEVLRLLRPAVRARAV